MTINYNSKQVGGGPAFPPTLTEQVYEALLSQTGTANPSAIVLLNTTGATISWVRSATGDYSGEISKSIDMDKTSIICNGGLLAAWNFNARVVDPAHFQIQTAISGTLNDDALLNTYIQIKIYK